VQSNCIKSKLLGYLFQSDTCLSAGSGWETLKARRSREGSFMVSVRKFVQLFSIISIVDANSSQFLFNSNLRVKYCVRFSVDNSVRAVSFFHVSSHIGTGENCNDRAESHSTDKRVN